MRISRARRWMAMIRRLTLVKDRLNDVDRIM
jgi:hypothetical protein